MSLAQSDDIVMTEDDVRSPHSFHLSIMARFGIPIFLLWLYWLFLLFKPIFSKKLSHQQLAITCILIGFIFNASFDVFLEGPMGAFPFWTWVGLLFMSAGDADPDANTSTSQIEPSSINHPNS
jgi:hypothetical protein